MKYTYLAIIAICVLLTGIVAGQYPYYSGYYGLSNAYWSAQPYTGQLAYSSPDSVFYYNVYAPGGYSYGASAYDYQSNTWAYYNGRGYDWGYSRWNPYRSW